MTTQRRYPRMSLWRHLLNRWSQLAIRHFVPFHRAYGQKGEPWHRARWEPTGPDVIVHNPWWNIRWLMEARSCAVCGEMRSRAIGWER